MVHIPIHVQTKTTATPGPTLKMDCPNCGAKGVDADTADVTAKERLFGLIQVTTTHWTTIACRDCGRSFRSSIPCAGLASMSMAQISNLVATTGMSYVDNTTKIFIIASFILPGAGVLFALLGMWGTRKTQSAWRTVSKVGLIFSAAFLAFIILGSIFDW